MDAARNSTENGIDPGGTAFIEDRALDNKLYYQIADPPLVAGEPVNVEVVRFFHAELDPNIPFATQAHDMHPWFASCMENFEEACIVFDKDGDSDVDLRDCACFQEEITHE